MTRALAVNCYRNLEVASHPFTDCLLVTDWLARQINDCNSNLRKTRTKIVLAHATVLPKLAIASVASECLSDSCQLIAGIKSVNCS